MASILLFELVEVNWLNAKGILNKTMRDTQIAIRDAFQAVETIGTNIG